MPHKFIKLSCKALVQSVKYIIFVVVIELSGYTIKFSHSYYAKLA